MLQPSVRSAGFAAIVLASTFTTALLISALTSRYQQSGAAGSRTWRLAGLAPDVSVCHWGVTAGYGQPICSAWGITPFPATSVRPVAIWLAASVLSGVAPRVAAGTATSGQRLRPR